MILACLYLLALTLLLQTLPRWRSSEEQALRLISQQVGQWRLELLAKRSDFLFGARDDDALSPLGELVKTALFAGYGLDRPLNRVMDLLDASALAYAQQGRLVRLVRCRCWLILALGLAGRSLLSVASSGEARLAFLQVLDSLSLLASLLLLGGGLLVLGGRLPEDWFWQKGRFSDGAYHWLTAVILGKALPTSPFAADWQRLEEREFAAGLDESEAKFACLEYWLRGQSREQEHRQRVFEDLLPLFELISLGLPALLLLAMPVASLAL